jgi:hypothetical protein
MAKNITSLNSKESSSPKSMVAVAVPLSSRTNFTADEQISLLHLNYHLKNFDRYFIIPENLDIDFSEFKKKRFRSSFFGSVNAHRKLLFSKSFYQAFAGYKYILIYHLDALVFSDQLIKWCENGFDYIGPPWIIHKDAPYSGNPAFEGKVGNGGFSLRKVESFLSVINSGKLWKNPLRRALSELIHDKSINKYSGLAKFFLYWHPKYNGVLNEMEKYIHNEDHFWANRATHYSPKFKVAPLENAIKFAFECVPRYCYHLNGKQLPFGCHAWNRYDREFWEPFLMSNIG